MFYLRCCFSSQDLSQSQTESKVRVTKLILHCNSIRSDMFALSSRPRKEQILPSAGTTFLLLSMVGVIGFRLDSFDKNKEVFYELHFRAKHSLCYHSQSAITPNLSQMLSITIHGPILTRDT